MVVIAIILGSSLVLFNLGPFGIISINKYYTTLV